MSAQAVGRGGTMTAESGDPLDAIEGNPAALAGLRDRVLDMSAVGLLASGSFRNSVDPNGQLTGVAGALPFAAAAFPIGKSRWIAGAGITPDLLMRANWRYLDPPGTAGATYGVEYNESEIAAIRSSAALAWTMGHTWAAGASIGLDYNRNTLKAPYIFQQQPQLAGLKVLLDLSTRGFGWNGSLGVQWRPSSRLQVGAAWKSPTWVQSHGDASGTASAQFAALGIAADPVFHYRAEVDNQLPQSAALGASFRATRRMTLGLEGDWTNWGDAFRQLPVKLTQGTNATINSVVAASSLRDAVPLAWHNQGLVRAGVEMPLAHHWDAAAGYSYMSDPVPGRTLTPLTAAILRNSLSAAAGWSRERWHWNLAYQIQLPASQSVGQSSLLAGEYNNTRVQVMDQSLTLSARTTF
jgi:long-subunit fatty acid transport protein